MKQIIRISIYYIATASSLQAKGLGEFVGTVSVPLGAVVGGAKVNAWEAGRGFARSVITSNEGFYTIPSLRPSQYNLTVQAAGFRSFSQSGIQLQADQGATVNFK